MLWFSGPRLWESERVHTPGFGQKGFEFRSLATDLDCRRAVRWRVGPFTRKKFDRDDAFGSQVRIKHLIFKSKGSCRSSAPFFCLCRLLLLLFLSVACTLQMRTMRLAPWRLWYQDAPVNGCRLSSSHTSHPVVAARPSQNLARLKAASLEFELLS